MVTLSSNWFECYIYHTSLHLCIHLASSSDMYLCHVCISQVIGRSGPKPERPQSYPSPSRCGPSRSGPIGRCGPSRSGPTGSMRPQSIRPHFTQKTFYRVRPTYHGPALVDPAPLCIGYISLVILPSYLRLTMSGLGRSGPTLQTRHIYLVI